MYQFHNQHLIIEEIEHLDVKYFYDTIFVSIHHFVNPFMKNKFPIAKIKMSYFYKLLQTRHHLNRHWNFAVLVFRHLYPGIDHHL